MGDIPFLLTKVRRLIARLVYIYLILSNHFGGKKAALMVLKKLVLINLAITALFSINIVRTRVARFFLVHDTKTRENVPNEHKMYPMVIKYPECL
jgi:hypothetical protein